QMIRQEDPGEALAAAIAEAENGLALRSDSAGLANDLVTALRYSAERQFNLGQDPEPTIARAIAVAHQALQGSRLRDYLLNNLGNCLEFKAELQMGRGQDPEPTVREAIHHLQEAARLKPWVGHSSSEGGVTLQLATYQAWLGKDNAQALADSLRALREAERLNANSYRVQLAFLKLHLLHARKEGLQQAEIIHQVTRARQAFDRTTALNPGLPEAAALEASVFALEAQVSTSYAKQTALEKGIRALQRSFESAERSGGRESLVIEAAGDLLEAGGEIPTILAPRIIDLATRVVAMKPWDSWGHFQRGRLLQCLGRSREASLSLDEAIRRNPNLARLAKAARDQKPSLKN
ncbi:MAG: hypothetical protein Q8O00_11770, partial [Holophaga sp.]|nr:hypothetical protein [Holophaga sp.]